MVLAVLLYGIVAAIGANVPSPMWTTVLDDRSRFACRTAPLFAMPADGSEPDAKPSPGAFGWQTGDRVVSINGNKTRNIMDVGIDAVLGAGSVLNVRIERPNPDGTTTQYLSPVRPTPLMKDKRMRSAWAPSRPPS